jgi:hypothetical protein
MDIAMYFRAIFGHCDVHQVWTLSCTYCMSGIVLDSVRYLRTTSEQYICIVSQGLSQEYLRSLYNVTKYGNYLLEGLR